MDTTKIKAGYRVSVTSWENDADNYRTGVLEGLSKEEAKFIVDLSKLFYSKNSSKRGFGNMYEPSHKQINALDTAVRDLVAEHPITQTSALLKDYFVLADADESLDGLVEFLYDIELSGGEFYTRVLESYKVEHIPEVITIQDVTRQFN